MQEYCVLPLHCGEMRTIILTEPDDKTTNREGTTAMAATYQERQYMAQWFETSARELERAARSADAGGYAAQARKLREQAAQDRNKAKRCKK